MMHLVVVVLCLTRVLVSGRYTVEDSATDIDAEVLDETQQVNENRPFIRNNISPINRDLENKLPQAGLTLQETTNTSLKPNSKEMKSLSSLEDTTSIKNNKTNGFATEDMKKHKLPESATNERQVRDVESSVMIFCAVYIDLSKSDDVDSKQRLCGGNNVLDNKGICRPIWCWEIIGEDVCGRNVCADFEAPLAPCEGKTPQIYKVDCKPEITHYDVSINGRCILPHDYSCGGVGNQTPRKDCDKGMIKDVLGNCRPLG